MEDLVIKFFDYRLKLRRDPPRIGIDVRPCTDCGRPLSCSNGEYWCRRCHAAVKRAVQKYIKTLKEGK